MKITVDYQACEANGLCVGIAPDIFQLDDDDNLHVTELPGKEAKVRQAVRSCPKMALSIDEG